MKKYVRRFYSLLKAIAADPRLFARVVDTASSECSGYSFSRGYKDYTQKVDAPTSSSGNPLWEYFQKHKEGLGIWKWEHYFDIYHRHFARFIGQKVNILEIGIYSGGSLGMWRSYFGVNSHVYGVDIEEACKSYENDHVTVFIGDQADRSFWSNFRNKAEGIDILIDDGGHTPTQQQITLEEMLPHLRPGGVYLCEDIHGCFNRFSAFAAGLVHELNGTNLISGTLLESGISRFQASIHSIHFYPYVVVIEKQLVQPTKLSCPRRGTEWQPFL